MTWKYKSDPSSPLLSSPPFPFSFSERSKPRSSRDRDEGGGRGKVSEFLATASSQSARVFFEGGDFAGPIFRQLSDYDTGNLSSHSLSRSLALYARFESLNKRTDFFPARSRSFRPQRRSSSSTLVYIFRIVSFLSFAGNYVERKRGDGMEWRRVKAISPREKEIKGSDRRRPSESTETDDAHKRMESIGIPVS